MDGIIGYKWFDKQRRRGDICREGFVGSINEWMNEDIQVITG